MLNLLTPLSEIYGIGPKFLERLKKLEIESVGNLLRHFPFRYEDFSQIYKITELKAGQQATVQGIITNISLRRSWQRRMFLVEALISDETGSIKAIWFNQPYLKNVLHKGKLANFAGKVSFSKNKLYLSNPIYEIVSGESEEETKHTGRLVPIYPETKGLTSKGIRYLIKPILENLEEIPDFLPASVLKKNNLPEINSAIQKIHFPENPEEAQAAKKRFAFEDLFCLQLSNILQRLKLNQEKAVPLKVNLEWFKYMISQLPFELTIAQKKSLWEILQDLQKSHPMNRLLQGDVGSGKTIVAALAALATAKENKQSVFMAPTEILAHQHYQTFIKFFPEFNKGLALITSEQAKVFYGDSLETEIKKSELLKEIALGKIKIVIGTHALISTSGRSSEGRQKGVVFNNLVFVVIDEQHRFGVKQRAKLLKNNKLIPHFLSMSATPIPRTLSLTIFGDLDLSIITELPKNRKAIITKVVAPANRDKAYAFIRGQVKKGRQAFVICPRIETNDENSKFKIQNSKFYQWQLSAEVKAVKEEYEKLKTKIFPDLKVAMLHGKMPARGGSASGGKATKEQIMKDFAAGKIDILVSTSVVEVGVDIPNAVIMMIEGAERFGLAQLYQFRGRVGRGVHQSFCFLFTDSSARTTQQRLQSIIEAKNGLELAEKDLEIRGPGEFLGQSQTGMPDLAMKAIQNPDLVKSSREAALEIIQKNPKLVAYPLLKEKLNKFSKEVHLE